MLCQTFPRRVVAILKKQILTAVASVAVAAILVGGASAAGLITSADIKDHTIRMKDLRAAVVAALSQPGPQGEAGPKGDAGATGSTGLPGQPGTNGLDGKTVLNGTAAPDGAVGTVGDFYLDTVASRLYGPKTGSGWDAGTSLVGPAGTSGYEMVTANAGGAATVSAVCPAGKNATGGGANSDGTLVDSYPFATCPIGQFCGTQPPNAWSATRSGGTTLTAYVLCMDVTA
jgi:hypothetical protein